MPDLADPFAFDGLKRINAMLKGIALAAAACTAALGPTATALNAVVNSAQTLQNLIDSFKAHGGTAGSGTRPDKPTTPKEYDETYAKELEAFQKQITDVMGPNNYFASLIGTAISGIRAGYIAPSEALAWLQNQFVGFSAGLMQEIADPNTSPAMRALAQELERFISSGSLQ